MPGSRIRSSKLGATPPPLCAASLAGRWRVRRVICDRASGQPRLARFVGEALIAPAGDGLTHVEQGELRAHGGAFTASRSFMWRLAPGRAELLFADGALLAAFDLAAGPCARARHLCADDVYDGALQWRGDAFALSWRVTGPRKNYALAGRYVRRPPAA